MHDVASEDQAVDHDLNVVLDVLLERDLLGEIIHAAVHAHADIAGSARIVKDLRILALASADDRRHDLHARPLAERHQRLDDLVDRLLPDLPAALGTVRRADARPQKSQIVVDLRHRADRRARILRGRLLVDGDRGGEPLDIIDVRLFLLSQKHARVGGKTFHIPALSLGINGVERKA